MEFTPISDPTKYRCGTTLASGCIPFTGPDLQFIGDFDFPCNGTINDVIGLMDQALTNILSQIDLTGLNVRCLSFNPATVTVKGLHQVEIDKICALDSALTALQTQVDDLDISDMEIEINLQCLTPAASPCATAPNTYTLISILNVIVTEVCAIKTFLGI